MPTFAYTARLPNGDLRSATLDAASRDEAVARLRQQRLAIVKVDESAKKPSARGKVPMRDIVIFTRQFATMINAGLPLVQALDILARQSENKNLQAVTRAVVYDVESGSTVADAMRNHPKAFSDLYVNMVAAGEAGGILDTILNRLAEFLEKTDALVRKVKGAMIYPAVIMGVAVLAIVILLWKVIPVFQEMFASVSLELPLPTKIVIGASDFLQAYWWALIAGRRAAAVAVQRYYATPAGKLQIDRHAAARAGDRRRAAQERGEPLHAHARAR
jgi:type IV pilus assembly protein PilC